jgi:hypothetical protein
MSIFIRKILAELTLIEPFDLSINTQRWDTRRSFPEALVMARLYSNENFPLPVVSERRCAPKPASLSLAGGAC